MNVVKNTDWLGVGPGDDSADAAMERYSKGDEAAFADVYDAIALRLLGFLRKATRDEAASEDLLQQTLLQLHRERGSFIPGARVMPWAFAIARRLMIDSVRRRRVEQSLFADAPADDDRMTDERTAATATAEALLHARRLAGRIQQRLDALPEAQCTAYKLLQQEGLSLKGAAEVLGTSVTAVKLRAHRAYQALRAVFRYETGVWGERVEREVVAVCQPGSACGARDSRELIDAASSPPQKQCDRPRGGSQDDRRRTVRF